MEEGLARAEESIAKDVLEEGLAIMSAIGESVNDCADVEVYIHT